MLGRNGIVVKTADRGEGLLVKIDQTGATGTYPAAFELYDVESRKYTLPYVGIACSGGPKEPAGSGRTKKELFTDQKGNGSHL